MRPLLKPALRRLWRDPGTLQLGLDPRHAVVLSGIELTDAGLLDLFDGTRDLDELTMAAEALGHPRERVRALAAALGEAAAIDDGSSTRGSAPDARLQPDLLSLSLLHREPGGAARVMAARGRANVEVLGAGRVGSGVAMLLAAAGVGQVDVTDSGSIRQADMSPGGIRRIGSRQSTRAEAVRDLIHGGAAPAAYAPPLARADTTVVLAPVGSMVPPEWLGQVRHRPHLPVVIRETTALIGPFVLPGQTPCLRCVELTRGERDPAWPMLAAQLIGNRHALDPCDVVLAAAASAIVTLHVLAWLDHGVDPPPPTIGGTVDLSLSDLRLRRRTVAAHPSCGCGAADALPLT